MPRARGFTLIELLVAISIMALVAILSWRGLDGMARAQSQTAERADSVLALQVALGQWGADLDAMVQLPPVAQAQPIDWDGRALRITRRAAVGAADGVTNDVVNGVVVVAWTRRGGDGASSWLRWQSLPVTTRAAWREAWQQAAQWAQTPDQALRAREIDIAPLTDWQLFFFRGNAWTNALSSADAAFNNPAAAPGQPPPAPGAVSMIAAPDGVRLVLDLPAGPALAGRITRDWVRPTLGGERS